MKNANVARKGVMSKKCAIGALGERRMGRKVTSGPPRLAGEWRERKKKIRKGDFNTLTRPGQGPTERRRGQGGHA
jgi:hypothetical protein